MENFKINDYNTNEQDKRSFEQGKGVEEFQNFNLGPFESLDPARQEEIEKTQESSKNEALEDLNDIYARAERNADRDDSSFFLRDDEAQSSNIIHFIHFKGLFATISKRFLTIMWKDVKIHFIQSRCII